MMLSYLDKNLDAKARARHLLSMLNLREKVGQLNQTLYGFRSYERREDNKAILTEEFREACRHWGGLGVFYGLYRADPWTQKNLSTGLDRREMIDLYNDVQREVISQSRFKIPVLFSQEAPHGPVQLDSYLLPVNLAAGAAFNPDLYRRACAVAARELNESGVHLALVSMLDVLRDPRWGRSEECYSEDPYLSAAYARAAVSGYQGDRLEGGDEGVYVVAKHFAAQGEGTGGINASAARIGERELREIHVPPMAAAAKAGAAGVMAAYNEIDGIFCHANDWLLRDLLRGELGFDGIVMADGIAIDNLNVMTGDTVESAALALRSGLDVSLWDVAFTRLEEACERYPELVSYIDEACERVLHLKFAGGLFDQPFIEHESAAVYTSKEEPAALNLARESIVLLKNDNGTLPFTKETGKTVAVIGPHINDVYTLCGDYTPYLNPANCRSIADGMTGYGEILAEEGTGILRRNQAGLERALELAGRADALVLTVGGSSSRFGGGNFAANGALDASQGDVDCGEGVDMADIELSDAQLELFRELRKLTRERGIPLVTVVVAGRPYAIPEIAAETDALLYSFYPGPEGGQAIADVIYGLAPAGRLPVSLPRSSAQIPVAYNAKASYQARYSDSEAAPLFGFGDGLTYTTFELITAGLSATSIKEDETVDLELEIKNTGTLAAAVVPQLYIRRRRSAVVPRVRELKAFAKSMIAPDETATITLCLAADDLKIWSRGRAWELEPGIVDLELRDQGKILWSGVLEIQA